MAESKADKIRKGLEEMAADSGAQSGEGSSFKSSGDAASLECRIRKRIVTLEDALEAGDVDLKVWRVKDYTINKWEMGYKDAAKEARIIPLWQVKVRLERIVPKCITDGLELAFARCKTLPRFKAQPPLKLGSRLFVPCLFDVHLGKYAWALETGTDQDTEIQRNVFRNAMADLIQLSGGDFERILLPVGNDFFQADNWLNQTAKGTVVDHDGRFPKVFDAGCEEMEAAIELLLRIAPVDVVYVPGNHDPSTSFSLVKYIEGRFHGNKHVRVDRSPSPRKYYRFGVNLLGLTHGNEEKTQDLPLLMAQERSQDWAQTSTHEWFTGHLHRKRSFVTKNTEEKMGVRVWTVPALSGTDSWHHAKAFVGCHRAAEGFVYGRESGYMGHWSVAARA